MHLCWTQQSILKEFFFTYWRLFFSTYLQAIELDFYVWNFLIKILFSKGYSSEMADAYTTRFFGLSYN